MNQDTHLLKKVLLFSKILREKKVGVTVDNVIDVFRGISFIDIRRKRDFYLLLRFNFVSRQEQITLFDEVFEQFWGSDEELAPPPGEREERGGEEEEDRSPKKEKGEFLAHRMGGRVWRQAGRRRGAGTNRL